MVDIVNGEIVRHDVTRNAKGGTELQAELMLKYIKPEILEPFQIIHSRVRDIVEDKKKILVLHDLAQDPEVKNITDPEWRKQFSKLVFVSDWQLQQYNMICGVPYRETAVLKNAIEPIFADRVEYDGTVHIVYHTTPHRGLNILVPVFEHLCKHFDNIHLHVYSSFSIYGWEERDEEFKDLFDKCRDHPNITYYGAVSNEEIREALLKTHIFAYPSIWPETSCIAAIEAMAAGNLVICPNYAALPETMGGFGWMYGWTEDIHAHANRFAATLYNAIQSIHETRGYWSNQQLQRTWSNLNYNVQRRAQQWEGLLRGL